MLLPNLAERRVEPEVMDQPGLDADAHHAALRGLARINRVSGSGKLLWDALRPRLMRGASRGPFRVLDVACGGGDVAGDLWRRAKRDGVRLHVTGVDVSDLAVRRTNEAARHAGAEGEVVAMRCDVLQDELPRGFDAAVTSLFVHHLEPEQAVRVLRRMREAAPLVVVNDLERSRSGYVAARLGTRVLSRSPVVHVDGPLSVKAALTLGELRDAAEEAGLNGARVVRRFPFRLVLTWEAA